MTAARIQLDDQSRQYFPGLFDKVFLDAACVSLAPRPAVEAVQKFLELAMVCPLDSSTQHHIFMDEMRAAARPPPLASLTRMRTKLPWSKALLTVSLLPRIPFCSGRATASSFQTLNFCKLPPPRQ